MPLPFDDFKTQLELKTNVKSQEIEKLDVNVFRMKGAFGSTTFGGVTLDVTEIYIKHPSEHQVEGINFDLEVQFYAPGKDGSVGIIFSKMFDEDEGSNKEFENLGFGLGTLKGLKNTKKFTNKGKTTNLKNIMGDSRAFINYRAQSTIGKCEKVEWFILLETGIFSEKQVAEFEDPDVEIEAKTNVKGLRVVQNFTKKFKKKVGKRPPMKKKKPKKKEKPKPKAKPKAKSKPKPKAKKPKKKSPPAPKPKKKAKKPKKAPSPPKKKPTKKKSKPLAKKKEKKKKQAPKKKEKKKSKPKKKKAEPKKKKAKAKKNDKPTKKKAKSKAKGKGKNKKVKGKNKNKNGKGKKKNKKQGGKGAKTKSKANQKAKKVIFLSSSPILKLLL